MSLHPRVLSRPQRIDIFSKNNHATLRVRLPILLVVLFCMLVGICSVWERMQYVRIGYDIERLKQKHEELVQEKRNLLLEYNTSISLGKVEERAGKELHMRLPEEGQAIYVE
jgi:cell division protein FtsL